MVAVRTSLAEPYPTPRQIDIPLAGALAYSTLDMNETRYGVKGCLFQAILPDGELQFMRPRLKTKAERTYVTVVEMLSFRCIVFEVDTASSTSEKLRAYTVSIRICMYLIVSSILSLRNTRSMILARDRSTHLSTRKTKHPTYESMAQGKGYKYRHRQTKHPPSSVFVFQNETF